MPYFPSQNPINVRVPKTGSHIDKSYDPYSVVKSDKSIHIPREKISEFVSRGKIEPGAHQQEILLMAAKEHLRSLINDANSQIKTIDEKISSITKELDSLKFGHAGIEAESNRLRKEIAEAIKSISGIISREQSVASNAADLARELYELDEAILSKTKTKTFISERIVKFLDRRQKGVISNWSEMADWAESDLTDISGLILIAKSGKSGSAIEAFVDDIRAANGSGAILQVPTISPQSWSSDSSQVKANLCEAGKILAERIARFESELEVEKYDLQVAIDLRNDKYPATNGTTLLFLSVTDQLDQKIRKRFDYTNKELEKAGIEPKLMPKVPGDKALARMQASAELKVQRGEKQVKFARDLATIAELCLAFDQKMAKVLGLNAELGNLQADTHPKDDGQEKGQKEISDLGAKRKALAKTLPLIEANIREIDTALERMSGVFKEKREHADAKRRRSMEKAKELQETKAQKEAEEQARLYAETSRLTAIIERIKPKLVEELWRKDRFKFCKTENEHIVFAEFKSKVLALADIYIRDGGKLTAFALDNQFAAGKSIHWETDFDKDIARLALTSDKNYRLLLYLADEKDPVVMYVGAHSGSDRFLKESVRGKPKTEWVPEWHFSLFMSVLKEAVEAHAELKKLSAI